MVKSLKLSQQIKTYLILIFKYLNEYKLIYIGIALCMFCCFNFHFVFNDNQTTFLILLITLFFLVSFVFPIILGVIFVARCFIPNTRNKLLSNIIHSYIATIFIFASLYFQCSVLGDFNDAIHKKDMYTSQINIKSNSCPDLVIMRVADQRAFKGIKPRIWSGIDYPSSSLLYGPERNPDSWHYFLKNDYEDISVEQIERIGRNITEFTRIIEYQKENVKDVYIDCLYYSIICIATVGFGDISPNLWYTKLFTSFEVLIGLSIFVFAIGILFNNWTKK